MYAIFQSIQMHAILLVFYVYIKLLSLKNLYTKCYVGSTQNFKWGHQMKISHF